MKKIRLGNDIGFTWRLFTRQMEPYNVEGERLRLTYTTFRGVEEVKDFTADGNVVSWVFRGKDQKTPGEYTITLQKNDGEDNMLTVDQCRAFKLVARSCEAGGDSDCPVIGIETVELASSVDVQAVEFKDVKWDEIKEKPTNFADWDAEEGDEKFIANKPTIPSKVSELQNDSQYVTEGTLGNKGYATRQELTEGLDGKQPKGNYATKEEIPDTSQFITNTVNNLANYYLKAETYTKQEVTDLINKITTINFRVVEELPESGEANLIYLVKKKGSGNDVHDEYIWVESKWEKIGSTTVDLTNYYTKADADGKFALKTSIADMLTKTEASGTYATKQELGNINTILDNINGEEI